MKKSLPAYALSIVAVAVSMLWLDLPLAAWVASHLQFGAFRPAKTDLPDFLDFTVIAATIFCWAGYLVLVRRGIRNRHAIFLRTAGIAIPTSYALKVILKWAVGRTETRLWIWDHRWYGFHWFSGSHGFQGFPSGHMLVTTPVVFALCEAYPKYRIFFLGGWIVLGLLLVGTDYHFLGDVLAGALVGALVHEFARRMR